MKEEFLQFIWQYQYFDTQSLLTTEGKPVLILDKGKWNLDSGADFQYAQISIDGITWVGAIELHLKSSDWQKHNHNQKLAYQNVILHVVWEDDIPAVRADGTPLPTIAIAKRVFGKAQEQYHNLLMSPHKIPCSSQWENVKEINKIQLLDKALLKRLERKAKAVKEMLKDNHGDWEETAYQLLAKHWGMKINQEPFGRLAQRLPLKIINKQRDNLLQIEALLLGQAGLLQTDNTDEHIQNLQKEYHFLAQKYQLAGKALTAVEWQFAKLRPANFPTLRLAQFAVFVQHFSHLFSYFLHTNIDDLLKKPTLETSDYWKSHYNIGKISSSKVPTWGETAWQNILINVATVLLACYAEHTQNEDYMEKAIHLLQRLPAEKNAILEIWQDLGLKVMTAFDSQALIEQYNELCAPKKCLQCVVGASLLK